MNIRLVFDDSVTAIDSEVRTDATRVSLTVERDEDGYATGRVIMVDGSPERADGGGRLDAYAAARAAGERAKRWVVLDLNEIGWRPDGYTTLPDLLSYAGTHLGLLRFDVDGETVWEGE